MTAPLAHQHTHRPRLAWYGDDFTGATDTLATVAQAGLRSLLFLTVPSAARLAACGPLDAIGIAGAARAMSPARMQAELAPVGRFFAALQVPVMHYKCCSTFDSAAAVGNLATAIATLRPHVANRFVPIVGGQPNIGRYCLFSNLFAAAGTGGGVHRLDRHPTMRQHPVTPMGEADLRQHLAALGLADVAALHYPDYTRPAVELDAELRRRIDDGDGTVLLDVATPDHLPHIGRVIWQHARHAPLLAVGPSGVAQALTLWWQRDDPVPGTPAPLAAPQAACQRPTPPVFAFAGSLSPVTARQVAAAQSYQPVPLDAAHLLADPAYAAQRRQTVLDSLAADRPTLAYVANDGDQDARVDAGALALATADFVADIVRASARARPLRRIGIAGGDTSSRAVQAMPLWGLSYLGVLAPGVTLTRAHSDDPAIDGLSLMLKGGQMGPEDLFERLLRYPA